MRTSIEHSGGVNGEPRYTFKLIEVDHSSIHVDGVSHTSSLGVEITEPELREFILRGCFALEDRRIGDDFFAGKMNAEEYEAAKRKLDHEGPPMPTLASLLPGEVKP